MKRRQRTLVLLMLVGGVALVAAAAYLLLRADEPEAPVSAGASVLAEGEVPAALRLTVNSAGLHALPAAAVRAAGLLQGELTEGQFRLLRDGAPVPTFVAPLDGENALFFYAAEGAARLAPPPVFWLEPGAGLAMRERNAAPAAAGTEVGTLTRRWDDDEIFVALAQSPDPWFSARLFAPGSMSRLELSLADMEPAGAGRLALSAWSNNEVRGVEPDHHLLAAVNETPVLDYTWDGQRLVTISGTVSADTLRDASQLLLNLPNDTGAAGEDVYVDWVELTYDGRLALNDDRLTFVALGDAARVAGIAGAPLVLDISDPATPVRLRDLTVDGDVARFATAPGESFTVATADGAFRPVVSAVPQWEDLRDPQRGAGGGADYLVIHADVAGFADALQPLLVHRAAQGLSTARINVRQVYDQFGYGRGSTEAIRDFIAYVTTAWSPAPRFVLLAGDASYDVNGANPNLLPTRLIFTEFAGYVASDTWFTVPGGEAPPSPITALGRLPAQSAADLADMVGKTLAYETSSSPDWSARALLVADDERQFDEASNALAFVLDGAGYTTEQLHMTEREEIGPDILAALNSGVGLVNYVGHGSVGVWGDERVLQTADAAALTNSGRYPIFVTFTCLNGYFNHPEVDALAEALMRAPDGGIVASVAPSGRSLTTQQRPIADAFYDLLLSGQAATVGEALQRAKSGSAGDPFFNDVIHTFNLLGDPALQFQHPTQPS